MSKWKWIFHVRLAFIDRKTIPAIPKRISGMFCKPSGRIGGSAVYADVVGEPDWSIGVAVMLCRNAVCEIADVGVADGSA